jgi:hypothetical protein
MKNKEMKERINGYRIQLNDQLNNLEEAKFLLGEVDKFVREFDDLLETIIDKDSE